MARNGNAIQHGNPGISTRLGRGVGRHNLDELRPLEGRHSHLPHSTHEPHTITAEPVCLDFLCHRDQDTSRKLRQYAVVVDVLQHEASKQRPSDLL